MHQRPSFSVVYLDWETLSYDQDVLVWGGQGLGGLGKGGLVVGGEGWGREGWGEMVCGEFSEYDYNITTGMIWYDKDVL